MVHGSLSIKYLQSTRYWPILIRHIAPCSLKIAFVRDDSHMHDLQILFAQCSVVYETAAV